MIQVSRRQPAGFEGIVGPFHVTPDIISRQIDNDKMEPDAPVRVPLKKIEGINGLPSVDGNARLFQNFALGPLLQGFAQFQRAAGHGPQSSARSNPSPDQQNLSIPDDHSADPDNRPVRIFTFRHVYFSLSMLNSNFAVIQGGFPPLNTRSINVTRRL